MRRIGRAVLVLLLLVGAVPRTGVSGAGQDELEAIRARIRRLQARLETLRGREQDARTERDRIEAELELARARVEALTLSLERSRERVEALREEARSLGEELGRRRDVLLASLQMAALLGRPGPLQLFADAVHGGDLERTLDRVSVLTEGQARLLHEYEDLRIERRRRLAELSRAIERMRIEQERLSERRAELEALEKEASARLKRIERETRKTENRLEELTERAGALERLMARLESRTRISPEEDIRRYRGALPWPARGTVVERFGRHRLRRYATYTVCNGIRLRVPAGTVVRAVFPGEVAFARYFKGYGNTVVIDHGHGVYTVTAGLATILVPVGRTVAMNDPIGRAGAGDSGGNLYFEVRSGGHAVDPLRWLRLRGGTARE